MATAGDEYYIQELGSLPYMIIDAYVFLYKPCDSTSNMRYSRPPLVQYYRPASYNKNWIFYYCKLSPPRYDRCLSDRRLHTEELVYYYRPTKDASCGTDSVPQPTGYEDHDNLVFVTAMMTAAATAEITSGFNAVVAVDVPAGITTVSAPMAVGS
ncbi:hypothetical protein HWV62_403 [Athelia sp. TMB]|nr:hypothetical protein HWV62_403 [Athelia sp. TMB]